MNKTFSLFIRDGSLSKNTDYVKTSKTISEMIMQSKSLFIFVDSSYQTADAGNQRANFMLQMVFGKSFISLYVLKPATSILTIIISSKELIYTAPLRKHSSVKGILSRNPTLKDY